MGEGFDPIGALLLRSGIVTEALLAELLDRQQRAVPLASLIWAMGYADEEQLARVLAEHHGAEAVVLERSVFALDTFARLAERNAPVDQVLPIGEDDAAVYVVVDRPSDVRDALMDVEYLCGKPAVARVALNIVLGRTARACAAALGRGEAHYVGPLATSRAPYLHVVRARASTATHETEAALADTVHASAVAKSPGGAKGARVPRPPSATPTPTPAPAPRARKPRAPSRPSTEMTAERRAEQRIEEVTKEMVFDDLVNMAGDITAANELDDGHHLAEAFAHGTRRIDRAKATKSTSTGAAESTSRADDSATFTPVSQAEIGESTGQVVVELDADSSAGYRTGHGGVPRVIVVDDDFAARQLLVKELRPLGYEIVEVGSAAEAVASLRKRPADVVVADVMLPDMGGFQLCRAIKESKKYGGVGVILVSAVIDSGRVSEEVLTLYGADDYFEKPLSMKRIKRRLRQLLVDRGAAPQLVDETFDRALALYREGKVDTAIDELRRGLDVDPMSAKHHFVLANLLQKKQLLVEAIDEYEAVLDLKPDYFPALTRLAYLYYKKGLATKAIDTWRRALPVCPDASLRDNIEGFMRKLIAELAHG